MSTNNPDELIHAFFRVFNQGDLEGIMTMYEAQPSLMAQPDQVAEGPAAVREALTGFLAMKPTLTPEKYKIVKANDLALSVIKWTMTGMGTDGKPVQMEGTSADVMRKQPDGRWLFVIDNPWGVGILG
jgi:ketosteroid isomerase-like protein